MMNLVGIYRLGWREAGDGIGMTYDHPDTLRSRAYDAGRYNRWRWWAIREALRAARRTYRDEMQP